MDQPDKIDCKANGEVIFRAMRSLQLKSFKNDSPEGSCIKLSRSRSQISTKKGIDSGTYIIINKSSPSAASISKRTRKEDKRWKQIDMCW